MRHNDHDVSGCIRTTDPAAVCAEVTRLYLGLYPQASGHPIEHAFADAARVYHGRHPRFERCDTGFHDLQHALEVALAQARLMDGYERARRGTEPLPPALFTVGAICALFHDVGYVRRRGDRRHRNGAEYVRTHVSRGAAFLHEYLREAGLARYANAAAALVHFTGQERPPEAIRLDHVLLRRIGQMLGTADILAQMSDRCYLEKCRDRLFPELVSGGLARGRYRSGEDLVRATPGLFIGAAKRLDLHLARAYEYAARHFGGQNPYLEEIHKNVRHARVVADAGLRELLRRTPPVTLAAAAGA
jgi:HD superfamily phosphodiesterase